MNGIDILNKEEILTTPEWIGLVLTISAVISIVSIIFAFWLQNIIKSTYTACISSVPVG